MGVKLGRSHSGSDVGRGRLRKCVEENIWA